MKKATKDLLRDFAERAAKLEKSRFLASARKSRLSLMPNGPGSIPVSQLPNEEELHAFLLRLRFFIQDNEPTSLRNVAKALEGDGSVPKSLLMEVEEVRRALNETLRAHPPVRVTWKGVPDSPRWEEIFEVFVYGEHAHASKRKRAKMDVWKKNPRAMALFSYYFVQILTMLASGICFLGHLFEESLVSKSKKA